MPIYEYECDGCRSKIEILRSHAHMNDPVVCECGEAMRICFGAPAVRRDYSDISYFGTEQYADARRKQCGVEV